MPCLPRDHSVCQALYHFRGALRRRVDSGLVELVRVLKRVKQDLVEAGEAKGIPRDDPDMRRVLDALHIREFTCLPGPIEDLPLRDDLEEHITVLVLNRKPASGHGGPIEPDRRWPRVSGSRFGAIWVRHRMEPLQAVFAVARQAHLIWELSITGQTWDSEDDNFERTATEYALTVVRRAQITELRESPIADKPELADIPAMPSGPDSEGP